MAARKKKIKLFSFSKKKKQKFVTLGLVAVLLFAFWVHHTYKKNSGSAPPRHTGKPRLTSQADRSLPRPALAHSIPLKPARPKSEPIVYYKQITPAPIAPPAPRRISATAPKIAFVIDDIGNTASHLPEIEKLGRDVTYAILPMLPHSALFDRLSLKTGAEVILHLPLESYKGNIPGPGLITTSMPDDFVLEELNRNLASVPRRIGVNNHMGSKGTSDPRIMDLILAELQRRNLLYLDSRTTSQSVAPVVAQELGMTILRRDEFLDNVDRIPEIRLEIKKLAAKSKRKGYAVGIGHYRLNTLKVLQEMIPQLRKEGFEIVSLRELLEYKKSARA